MSLAEFDNGRLPDGPYSTAGPLCRQRLDLYVRKLFIAFATNAKSDYFKLNVHQYCDINHDKWIVNKDNFLYKTARDIKIGVIRLMKADVEKHGSDVQNLSVYDYLTLGQIKGSMGRLETWVAENRHPYLGIRPNVGKITKTGKATKWFVRFAEDKESQRWAAIVGETHSEMWHRKRQKEADKRWANPSDGSKPPS